MWAMEFAKWYNKDIKRCFLNGAFVFEDPTLAIFKKLSSYDAYPRISSHQRHFGTGIQSYGIDVKPTVLRCASDATTVRTVLFFTYTLPSALGKNIKRFTYVKLESYGTKMLSHFIMHSVDYVRTRFDSFDISKRRESTNPLGENRKKYVFKEARRAKEKICKELLPECSSRHHMVYTKYYRRGHEVYVPSNETDLFMKSRSSNKGSKQVGKMQSKSRFVDS